MARQDGRTKEERLEGLWPKNEDLHAMRMAYDTVLKILNKPNSLMDWGAYASNPLFLVIKMDYLMSWTTMTK
ncbi:unnamed protein product [Porites evermanni]|uniref:Uncharacterized protein n=1 Tax=Porites evermanni TaxID=104178 RepID=A0ABN8LR83_9CNID|nr:unnamed protein product [Porites evermanni]